jgi:FAD/FMN-containing dehydrogenase
MSWMPSQKCSAAATARRRRTPARRKGNPSEVDAELWTTQLDRVVAYEPAEMIAVVEGGIRVGELERLLAEHEQEWPSDAPDDATVGGVMRPVSSPRRLKLGPVRDSVLETEMVTGDGRFVKSGARVVKSVTGYDLHKLVVGSLGTLAVIVQVALKVRPLPKARRTLFAPGWLSAGEELRGGARRGRRDRDARRSRDAARGLARGDRGSRPRSRARRPGLRAAEDVPFPTNRPWGGRAGRRRGGCPGPRSSRLPSPAGERWGALLGVGLMWSV